MRGGGKPPRVLGRVPEKQTLTGKASNVRSGPEAIACLGHANLSSRP